jgi:DNA-3-methyladenine glycosylase II
MVLPASHLRALARRDPKLGKALKKLPPFPGFPSGSNRRATHYEAIARAIVYQQVTGKAAATIHSRVCALTDGPRFPAPEQIERLSHEQLRGAGLSNNKALAVRDLAERVLDGRLRLGAIGRRRDDEVVEHLVQVRGIGVWSAQMFLMFKLGRLDVLPTGDLGVQEGVKILHGLKTRPGPEELAERCACWRPLSSVGSWYAWRALEARREGLV